MKQNFLIKKYGYILLIGAIALTITCGINIQKNGSIKVVDSIVKMNINDTITNETAIFKDEIKENDTENKGLIIEEKIAIDPIYIFSSINELKYNKENIDIKIEPKDDCENFGVLEKGSSITILGYNDFGYAKILYNNEELYIKNENLTNNKDEIFFDCELVRYTADAIELYDSIKCENVIETIDKYLPITVIGENDSSFYYISYNDKQGYINKEQALEFMPKETYIRQGEDGVTDYYFNNMYEGVLAEIPDQEKTEENIEFLAKLIHCEAGGQTEEGKLSVATVVVNRVYDKTLGNTIKEVIERPGQFQPVGSGIINNTTYTEDDYNAAYKVIVDGYRSFPAYVMYFQSLDDGYFGGHSTYCTCYTASKTMPQYFSYKESDLAKYKN